MQRSAHETMRINAKTDYAFHAAIALARSKQRMNAIEISETTGVTRQCVVQGMKALIHAGLVQSQRGPGVGYVLLREPSEITAWDIIYALEGDVCLTSASSFTEELPVWRILREDSIELLKSLTLEELTK